ncbi:iron(III) transport system permease protein [Breznakia blatticola]|uniref:Iron(III) transport system permease protein n=1 Tax=Breznakia blatticola TaxID=1754012 RepID=A0A4V3G627_9FIRM|nr:ABC transporter permease subunit [Breznakia blatticola]TDW08930.1 iron(III) transport system permease protein [Breznakia blatticola]
MFKRNHELKLIYIFIFALFAIFLFYPLVLVLMRAIQTNGVISLDNIVKVISKERFVTSLSNSFLIASITALLSTGIAFFLAYTIHFTSVPKWFKKLINLVATMPMLMPTITYGFAIIYTFGKQGVFTKIFGFQPFNLYGFNGLLIGYLIYTLPIAFVLIKNTMTYIDKKQFLVSILMGDSPLRRFFHTVFRPLAYTLVIAFIQTFFLSFTDFGIPAAIGGQFEVIASTLYNQMLGSIPNFHNGAVISLVMLIPSIVAVLVVRKIEKMNVRYENISDVMLPEVKKKNWFCGIVSACIMLGVVSVFAVIFILPFVKEWPYDISFSFVHVIETFQSANLLDVVKNSFIVAIATAVCGTIVSYVAAIISARGKMPKLIRGSIDFVSTLTNALPGMVVGIGFMFAFKGTNIQNTYIILIICNVVHFFSTPYVMIKNAFMKMNLSFETTGRLLGDSWFGTLRKVMIPCSISTVFEMFSYYFINSMVTISAIIFLVGAETGVITTKIKELQHFAKFADIFVLSLLIFIANIIMKTLMNHLTKKESEKRYYVEAK